MRIATATASHRQMTGQTGKEITASFAVSIEQSFLSREAGIVDLYNAIQNHPTYFYNSLSINTCSTQ